MLIRQVALVAKTKRVAPNELMRVGAALQRQVTRDLSAIWNVQATVDSFTSEADVPLGYWKIRVMDKLPDKGAGGFHFDDNGQPEADVLWSPAWSLAASHECLEMLVDPFGKLTQSGPSPKSGQDRVNFLVEVCDPCEAPAFAYTINTGTANEIAVSDFYTPEYFSPVKSLGVRYSFRGSIRAPRQVLPGGYLSWWNPADKHIWQLFGPVELGPFVDQGAGTLDRQTTDGHSRLTRSGNGCNLTPIKPGLAHGTAGDQTTVQIKDPTGTAQFVKISYKGKEIGTNTSSVSFTIEAGDNPLTYTYAAPVDGDPIDIVDPCGTSLDSFPSDKGNPRVTLTVSA